MCVIHSDGCVISSTNAFAAGDFIDKTTFKRPLLAAATLVAALCSCIIVFTDSFWVLATKSVIEGIAASVLDPGRTGLTLGITGQNRFEQQAYRNETANQTGYTLFMAALGVTAYFIFPDTNWLFIALGIGGKLARGLFLHDLLACQFSMQDLSA